MRVSHVVPRNFTFTDHDLSLSPLAAIGGKWASSRFHPHRSSNRLWRECIPTSKLNTQNLWKRGSGSGGKSNSEWILLRTGSNEQDTPLCLHRSIRFCALFNLIRVLAYPDRRSPEVLHITSAHIIDINRSFYVIVSKVIKTRAHIISQLPG